MKKFLFEYGGHFEFQVVASTTHISKMSTIENRNCLIFMKILIYHTILQPKISHRITQWRNIYFNMAVILKILKNVHAISCIILHFLHYIAFLALYCISCIILYFLHYIAFLALYSISCIIFHFLHKYLYFYELILFLCFYFCNVQLYKDILEQTMYLFSWLKSICAVKM